LLLLDLPPEEDLEPGSPKLIHIRLVAPTTPAGRIAAIAQNARGFLYYVSREGVTGAREKIASSMVEKVRQLGELSPLPVAVGFGISNPEQARQIAQIADAVVVGSTIVNRIAEHGTANDLVELVLAIAKPMIDAVKNVGR
jgi:tryptophan synthase alpha chain